MSSRLFPIALEIVIPSTQSFTVSKYRCREALTALYRPCTTALSSQYGGASLRYFINYKLINDFYSHYNVTVMLDRLETVANCEAVMVIEEVPQVGEECSFNSISVTAIPETDV